MAPKNPIPHSLMCDACREKLAPLALTHLVLKRNGDLKVACSSCLLNGRARTLYGSGGPGLWPARFYAAFENPPEVDLMPLILLILGLGLILVAVLGGVL